MRGADLAQSLLWMGQGAGLGAGPEGGAEPGGTPLDPVSLDSQLSPVPWASGCSEALRVARRTGRSVLGDGAPPPGPAPPPSSQVTRGKNGPQGCPANRAGTPLGAAGRA